MFSKQGQGKNKQMFVVNNYFNSIVLQSHEAHVSTLEDGIELLCSWLWRDMWPTRTFHLISSKMYAFTTDFLLME